MLGKFIAKYKECLTDDKGAVVVSFAVYGAEIPSARKCAAAALTAIGNGKERLKIEVALDNPKRSANANAYMWVLCDKIAEKIGSSKLEIYRDYILEQGVFDTVEINAEAVATYEQVWSAYGSGWLVEVVDTAARNGFVILHAYKGSSTYDKQQMSRLLDRIVSDAQELGIETHTPEEIAIMKQCWEGARL